MRAFWHACAALEKRASGTAVPVVLLLALLLRAYVGLHPHSGEATPPKFGDYEAQRHWMARACACLCTQSKAAADAAHRR
jgi:hypothetical protein